MEKELVFIEFEVEAGRWDIERYFEGDEFSSFDEMIERMKELGLAQYVVEYYTLSEFTSYLNDSEVLDTFFAFVYINNNDTETDE